MSRLRFPANLRAVRVCQFPKGHAVFRVDITILPSRCLFVILAPKKILACFSVLELEWPAGVTCLLSCPRSGQAATGNVSPAWSQALQSRTGLGDVGGPDADRFARSSQGSLWGRGCCWPLLSFLGGHRVSYPGLPGVADGVSGNM